LYAVVFFIEIDKSTFVRNKAYSDGVALYVDVYNINVTGSTFN